MSTMDSDIYSASPDALPVVFALFTLFYCIYVLVKMHKTPSKDFQVLTVRSLVCRKRNDSDLALTVQTIVQLYEQL